MNVVLMNKLCESVGAHDNSILIFIFLVSPWIGWKNDSGSSGPVEVTFEFDDVRNFSEVSVHMSNKFSNDVQVRNVENTLTNVCMFNNSGKIEGQMIKIIPFF